MKKIEEDGADEHEHIEVTTSQLQANHQKLMKQMENKFDKVNKDMGDTNKLIKKNEENVKGRMDTLRRKLEDVGSGGGGSFASKRGGGDSDSE